MGRLLVKAAVKCTGMAVHQVMFDHGVVSSMFNNPLIKCWLLPKYGWALIRDDAVARALIAQGDLILLGEC